MKIVAGNTMIFLPATRFSCSSSWLDYEFFINSGGGVNPLNAATHPNRQPKIPYG
jgi:hypothetical protein